MPRLDGHASTRSGPSTGSPTHAPSSTTIGGTARTRPRSLLRAFAWMGAIALVAAIGSDGSDSRRGDALAAGTGDAGTGDAEREGDDRVTLYVYSDYV